MQRVILPGARGGDWLSAMAILASLPSLEGQTRGLPWVHAVMPYLRALFEEGSPERTAVLGLTAGSVFRRPLGGGVVSIEQAFMTRGRESLRFETHIRNIDLQVLVSGREFMEIGPIAAFEVSEPYSKENDVTFYRPREPATCVLMEAGSIAIYFPEDVHRGQAAVGSPAMAYKAVLKIPVDA